MSITRDDKLFRSKVPWIVAGLMNEFATITAEDACAILGNLCLTQLNLYRVFNK